MNSKDDCAVEKRNTSTIINIKKSLFSNNVNKENIEQPQKKILSTTINYRNQIPSDSSCDKSTRIKGLQEVDLTNKRGAVPKNQNALFKVSAATTKKFTNAPFSIYDEDKNRSNISVPHNYARLKTDITQQFTSFKKQRPDILVTRRKVNNRIQHLLESQTTTDSPLDLPHIPTSSVPNIKEDHKKPNKEKHVTQEYELSLELAYNIEYLKEFINFQMELNLNRHMSNSFLRKNITDDQRKLLVKYLIQSATYFKYPSFILYQAVKIFDCYIDIVDVKVNELQVVALSSLWIALKREAHTYHIPEASKIIKLADPVLKGNMKPLIKSEMNILKALKFQITFDDPFSMLALYTILLEEIRDEHERLSEIVKNVFYVGSYLIDVSLLYKEFIMLSALHLSIICAEISLVFSMSDNLASREPGWIHWRDRIYQSNSVFEEYRLPNLQMDFYRNLLLQKIKLSQDKRDDSYVIFKKYNLHRYGSVSSFIKSRLALMSF